MSGATYSIRHERHHPLYVLSTDQEMIPAGSAKHVHAQNFVANELLLPILYAFAHQTLLVMMFSVCM